MKSLSLFSELFKKFRSQFLITIFVLFIEFAFDLVSMFAIAPVIDFLMNSNSGNGGTSSAISRDFIEAISFLNLPATLPTFLGVFLFFQTLKTGFFVFARYWILVLKYEVLRHTTLDVFETLFNARWVFFTGSNQGVILNTFNREMTSMGEAFLAMVMFLSGALRLLVFFSVPVYIAWKATFISIGIGFVFALPLLMLGPVNYRLGCRSTLAANRFMALLNEFLVSAKVVLGYGERKKSVSTLAGAFDDYRRDILKSQTLGMATPLVYEPFGIFAAFATILVAQRLSVPLSEIAVMLWAFMKAMPLIGHLIEKKDALENFYPSYEQIVSMRAEAKRLKQESGDIPFVGFHNEIKFDGVSFSYPGQPEVLKDIGLVVPKGKMVAIVGESGAGKSTLIDMVMGFNMPDRGNVTIDGVSLRDLNIESYRKRIGYVPQESILFNLSVRDNLLWSRENASAEEIWSALRQANAEDFVRDFPRQLETVVGDRGVRLSGGQCQRIALARAILRKPELLILDEATSALDTQSERLIQKAVETLAKETTIIVIAHRLSTIMHSDYIYVISKGRVVEEGKYEQLIQNERHFNQMVQMQMLGK